MGASTEARRVLSHDAALPLLQQGDVALFRGGAYYSQLIELGTGGPYSHAGMLRVNGNGVDLLEIRETIGGRAVPFIGEIKLLPRRIDIYRPDLQHFPEYDAAGAVKYMRELTSRQYGSWALAKLILRRVPGLWRAFGTELSDESDDDGSCPFCSQAVALAAQFGGLVDPVPHKPACLVTPNDLAWSLLFKYEFTVNYG